MRYIKKRKAVPDCLFNENESPPLSSESAARRWGNYNSSLLSELLIGEQFYLCAYSEISLESRALGFHIEHVKPKSKFPELIFSHKNLVLSALSSSDLESFEDDLFGGHRKQNHFDRRLFLSPLRSRGRRDYFLYLSDGRVVPSPDKSRRYRCKAEHTIRTLNLNASCLVNWRKRWIEELDSEIDQHLDADMSLFHLACIDLLPKSGRLSEFFTATRQRFGLVAKRVLHDFAKEF